MIERTGNAVRKMWISGTSDRLAAVDLTIQTVATR
jgi:hypothetical protein